MQQKIKLLSVIRKKPKNNVSEEWAKTVEMYAPDMYETLYSVGEKETLKTIKQHRPEIILLLQSVTQNDPDAALRLLQEIKQENPAAAVFVVMGLVDDEQTAIDAFMAGGAYKCYTAPIIMDTLFHDMYVALNLE